MTEPVLSAVMRELRDRDALRGTSVRRVTVGDAALLVELQRESTTDGGGYAVAGLAHRPPGPVPTDVTTAADPLDLLRPIVEDGGGVDGDLGGETVGSGRGARAAGIATLNALSAPFVRWRTGDPMELLDPDVEVLVTVGLFRPAFRKFANVEVRVVERDRVDPDSVSTPESVALRTFAPDETAAAMEDADVVFVTGSTLVYGGTGRYLEAAPPTATVVLVGATASMLPDPLFAAGVDVVAGTAVDDPRHVREAVTRGACGTDLHDHGLRKGYVVRERPSQIDLRPDTTDDTE